MITKPLRVTISIIVTLVLLFAFQTSSENLIRTDFGKKHRTLFGFKGGIINQTDFHAVAITDSVTDLKLRTRIGLSFQIFFDFPVNSKFFASFSIDIQDIHVIDERHQMLNLGLSLKVPIYKDINKIAWRPLVGVGFSYLGQGEALEKSSYTTGKVGIEAIFYNDKRHAYMGEFVVYGSLSGKNDNYDISFGPVVLIRFGVIY